jgi:hypothetical protein
MKKIAKVSFYWLIWAFSLAQVAISEAAMSTWKSNVNDGIVWSTDSADQAVQVLITSAIRFLYLVAVVYWLRWGFNILTAAWDEEKVKKWKTIIIHTIIWLIVIWLVGSIIEWVVTQLLWTT